MVPSTATSSRSLCGSFTSILKGDLQLVTGKHEVAEVSFHAPHTLVEQLSIKDLFGGKYSNSMMRVSQACCLRCVEDVRAALDSFVKGTRDKNVSLNKL